MKNTKQYSSLGGNFLVHALLLALMMPKLFAATSWSGLIGVDYQPNHYVVGNTLNNHDVFYVRTGETNIRAELAQLKAAGFSAVRSYQTTDYSWIELINQANALGMQVIYEAVIPYNGNNTDITAATTLLTSIINNVGSAKFQKTVMLILAGHENYCNTCGPGGSSNINYLTQAVSALQSIAPTIPVSSALVSGDLVAPPSNDIATLINSYSATAPLAFDPYPFQWGVPVAQAIGTVSNSAVINSIGWDYYQVGQQNFYTPPRPILMAESGWASAGTTNPGYACGTHCKPGVKNQANYLQALYRFVKNPAHHSGLLVFEAYDEPAKAPANNMEDYYGVFDKNCYLKGPNNHSLIPNGGFQPNSSLGCQGFATGALLTVVGFGNPYVLTITQTNPVTKKNASIMFKSNGKPGPLTDAPWPVYLVFPGARINIQGASPCTSTVKSIGAAQQITFSGNCNCPNDHSNNCYY